MNNESNYAYLPDELLVTIMEDMPETVDMAKKLTNLDDGDVVKGRNLLIQHGLISIANAGSHTNSLVAIDGGLVVEKMTGMDLLLAIAVGVEGLAEDPSVKWGADRRQFISWQAALPHHEANTRLVQGIMFLMELSVLSSSEHEIRIMDGSHLTPIMKLNSMLSAKDEGAGEEFIEAFGL